MKLNTTPIINNSINTITVRYSKSGTYLWGVRCFDNGNPPSSLFSENRTIIVKTLPLYSSENDTRIISPATYDTNNNYGFQINWTDEGKNFKTAIFQLGRPDGTLINYTNSSTIKTQYFAGDDYTTNARWYINFTQAQFGSVGTYNITWFGIDVDGAENKTDTVDYTINKGTPSGSISGTTPITYGTVSDVTGSESNIGDNDIVYNLYRDGVLVSNPDNTVLGAGTYNYVYNTTGGENYTSVASLDTFVLAVNKAPTSIRLFLNGTEGTKTYTHGDIANFTVQLNVSETIILTSNYTGWVDQTGTQTIYNTTFLGVSGNNFNITAYFVGNENYTSSQREYIFNVNSIPNWLANATSKTSPQIYDAGKNYGFQINWTDADFSNATLQLGRPDGTLTNYTISTTPSTTNTSNIWYINFTQDQIGGVGIYNYTWFGVDLNGAENKTDTINYVINKAIPKYYNSKSSISTAFSKSIFNISWLNYDNANYTISKSFFNTNTSITNKTMFEFGNDIFSINITLPAGSYSYWFFANNTDNLANYTSPIYFVINPAWNQTDSIFSGKKYNYSKDYAYYLGIPISHTESSRIQDNSMTCTVNSTCYSIIPINVTWNASAYISGDATNFTNVNVSLSSIPAGWTGNLTSWIIPTLNVSESNVTNATLYKPQVIKVDIKWYSLNATLNTNIYANTSIHESNWTYFNATFEVNNTDSIDYTNVLFNVSYYLTGAEGGFAGANAERYDNYSADSLKNITANFRMRSPTATENVLSSGGSYYEKKITVSCYTGTDCSIMSYVIVNVSVNSSFQNYNLYEDTGGEWVLRTATEGYNFTDNSSLGYVWFTVPSMSTHTFDVISNSLVPTEPARSTTGGGGGGVKLILTEPCKIIFEPHTFSTFISAGQSYSNTWTIKNIGNTTCTGTYEIIGKTDVSLPEYIKLSKTSEPKLLPGEVTFLNFTISIPADIEATNYEYQICLSAGENSGGCGNISTLPFSLNVGINGIIVTLAVLGGLIFVVTKLV